MQRLFALPSAMIGDEFDMVGIVVREESVPHVGDVECMKHLPVGIVINGAATDCHVTVADIDESRLCKLSSRLHILDFLCHCVSEN